MNSGTKTIYYRLGNAWAWRILEKLSGGLIAQGQAPRKRLAELAAKAKHKELRERHEQNCNRH
jgi:hypothetical protein